MSPSSCLSIHANCVRCKGSRCTGCSNNLFPTVNGAACDSCSNIIPGCTNGCEVTQKGVTQCKQTVVLPPITCTICTGVTGC